MSFFVFNNVCFSLILLLPLSHSGSLSLILIISILYYRSETPLSMEQWHTIRISRTARLAVMKVSILTTIVIVWLWLLLYTLIEIFI